MPSLRPEPQCAQLRILSTPGFGRKIVAPLLSGFHTQYPEIALELLLSDHPARLATDPIDVSFSEDRVGGSSIVARRLMPMQRIVCASPAYARAHGLPQHVAELARHRCINFRIASDSIQAWEFKVDGLVQRHQRFARHTFNDAGLIVQAVLDGLGIAQLPAYQVCGLLAERRLVPCLSQYAPNDGGHYLCYLDRQPLPAHIGVFVDYMTARMHALDL
ncbi:LysR substrate binding domain-containing protein [Paraburkholderia rhizosphaerae]|uniref:LysR substrate binding domain-containing protein n=1 Tax=Paraburkholderia rhizosphaerae TaxID=480658 RepID=A0A4R8LUE3_9BURK|nr:LysR substrate binding domain-containing protein [Paraburkholderia rhizosphaerae]